MTKASELRELNDDELDRPARRGEGGAVQPPLPDTRPVSSTTPPGSRASAARSRASHTLLREREIVGARGRCEQEA